MNQQQNTLPITPCQQLLISPRLRGLITINIAIACLLCKNVFLLFGIWICCGIVLVLLSHGKTHLSYCVAVILPLYLALLLIWVLAAPQIPDSYFLSRTNPGFWYATMISLRIATLGAIFQLCFLPLTQHNLLIPVLARWGIKGHLLTLCAATITLIDNLQFQTRQVWEARMARGLAKRGVFYNLIQLPIILRPLFISILYSAIKRAELWKHRNLPQVSAQLPYQTYHYSKTTSYLLFSFTLPLLVLCFINR